MADFNIAQNLVKRAEGGYTDEPRDPGNYTSGKIGVGSLIGTNYGISAPVLKKYLGYEPMKSEMQNLSYQTAEKIYKNQYWNAIKGNEITNQKTANMLYDTAVNMGQGRAHQFAKEALKTEKYDVQKINSANQEKLFNEIGRQREAFYIARGGYALKSWLNRLKDLGYDGLSSAIKNRKKITITLLFIGIVSTATYLYFKKT